MTRRAVARQVAAGAVALGLLLPAGPVRGQAVPEEEAWPSFEVASVKKITDSNFRLMMSSGQGGRLVMSGLPLRTLILQAYGIRAEQLIGGPGWLTSDRFAINAKAETNVARDQLLLMLRSLLAERFKLKMRREQREVTAYVLTRLNPDGPLGAGLRPSTCPDPRIAAGLPPLPPPGAAPAAVTAARGTATPPGSTPGVPPASRGTPSPPGVPQAAQAPTPPAPSPAGQPPSAAAAGRPAPAGGAARGVAPPAPATAGAGRGGATPPPRAMSSLPGVLCGGLSLSSNLLRGGGVPLSTLTSLIGSSVGGQVVDRTGLGIVDVEMEFSIGSAGSLRAAAPGATLPTTDDGPSIFAAVRDLGLKLERRREKVDSYVIESVEQPDED